MTIKTSLTILLLSALVSGANAQEYVCVDEAAIGFNWDQGQWSQVRFPTETRIIKKIVQPDDQSRFCFRDIEREGLSTEVVYGEFSGIAYGCYQNTVVGEKPSLAMRCMEAYKKSSGEMWAVRCSSHIRNFFDFAPNGEYVAVNTISVPDASIRDSLFMIHGKCSQLR